MTHKLVTILDRAYVLTSRGKCLGPIYPYYETLNSILKMIKQDILVVEVLPDNTGVILTEENYNKDNTTGETTPDIIFVKSIAISESAKTIDAGLEFNLTKTITPENATDQTVTWSSTDDNIAIVDQVGKVTTKTPGVVDIKVVSTDGNKEAKCTVTVTKPIVKVSGVTLDNPTLTLNIGEKRSLVETVSPEDATDRSVTWSSLHENIATVINGEVTAIAEGEATIKVVTTDGAKEASCVVTVTKPVINVTEITLDNNTLALNVGDQATLVKTITPHDATDQTVTWSSTDEGIVLVVDGQLEAVTAGEATIKVVTTDGDKEASCVVTVSEVSIP